MWRGPSDMGPHGQVQHARSLPRRVPGDRKNTLTSETTLQHAQTGRKAPNCRPATESQRVRHATRNRKETRRPELRRAQREARHQEHQAVVHGLNDGDAAGAAGRHLASWHGPRQRLQDRCGGSTPGVKCARRSGWLDTRKRARLCLRLPDLRLAHSSICSVCVQ